MSEITNPPLGPGTAAASEQANAAIDNPVLDPPGSGGSAATAVQNPPLDGGGGSAAADLQNSPLDGGGRSGADDALSANPPLSSISNGVGADGLNPPPDEADIERWFEQQLGQGAIAVPPAKKTATKRAPPKKAATKSAAKKRSAAATPAKKQAVRRRTTSKGSRTK